MNAIHVLYSELSGAKGCGNENAATRCDVVKRQGVDLSELGFVKINPSSNNSNW